MRTFSFSQTDLETIQHERFHHPHPRVQQKMEVLWLKSQGLTHEQSGHLADVSRRTVQRVLDDYLVGGIDQVRRLSFRRPESALLKHKGTLEDYFLDNPPASAAQAQAVIEKLTGIKRGLTQVRQFLKKSRPALSQGRQHSRQSQCRGTGRVPGNPTPAAVDAGPERPTHRIVC